MLSGFHDKRRFNEYYRPGATGTVGKISRSLKSTVGIGWAASSVNPVFSYAISASEGIEINNYGQVYGDIAVNLF